MHLSMSYNKAYLFAIHLQIFLALLFIVTALPHNEETILDDLADNDVSNPESTQQFFKLKKIKKLLFG